MDSQQQEQQQVTVKQESTSTHEEGSLRPIEPEISIGPDDDRKMSLDNPSRIAVSMDDPDVRIAAQALGDLRAGRT